MRKILFIAIGILVFAGSSMQLQASKYTLDNTAVDQLFEVAPSAALDVFQLNHESSNPLGMQFNASGDKDVVVALVLNFFLGVFGVHRFYLGTEVLTGIGYILTCGGIFGVVPLVDFIILIIDNKDISPYIDNPAFFMW